jgi:hypothetical protein
LNRRALYKGDDIPALILQTLAAAYDRRGHAVQAAEWGRRALAEYRAQLQRQPANRRLARGLAEEAHTLGDVLSRLAAHDPGRRNSLQREACAVADEGLRALRPEGAVPPAGEDATLMAALERALGPCGTRQAGGELPASSR